MELDSFEAVEVQKGQFLDILFTLIQIAMLQTTKGIF
jgi:hypothetical protein